MSALANSNSVSTLISKISRNSNLANNFDDHNFVYFENKQELKRFLKDKRMLVFQFNGIRKYYVDGSSFIVKGVRQKFVNAYGVCRNKRKYLAFITDENGDPLVYLEEFEFEDDACEALFEKILKIKD